VHIIIELDNSHGQCKFGADTPPRLGTFFCCKIVKD
jgi:hypothetical protein